MGYAKIKNLYADKSVLDLFKKVYALEKIHGTSAHVAWECFPWQMVGATEIQRNLRPVADGLDEDGNQLISDAFAVTEVDLVYLGF